MKANEVWYESSKVVLLFPKLHEAWNYFLEIVMPTKRQDLMKMQDELTVILTNKAKNKKQSNFYLFLDSVHVSSLVSSMSTTTTTTTRMMTMSTVSMRGWTGLYGMLD